MHPGECLTVFTHGCPFAMPKGDHSGALGLTQGASSTSFFKKETYLDNTGCCRWVEQRLLH